MTQWSEDFKENSIYRIDESLRMIEIAFAKVNEVQIWQRPNGVSNSLGNLVLHLCGNITQYVIASLGEQKDHRERDLEFETDKGFSKDQLLRKLRTTTDLAKSTIEKASEEQLLQKREVQGFYFSGMGCVIHAVEHFSYHTGQIAFWVKQLANSPLGFYDGMDLNERNK